MTFSFPYSHSRRPSDGRLKGKGAAHTAAHSMSMRRRLFPPKSEEERMNHKDTLKRMREQIEKSFREFDARYKVDGVDSLVDLSPRPYATSSDEEEEEDIASQHRPKETRYQR
ncbi:hypothetical protein PROFUN_04799 [Planoprotostelium fungivorum]|uniref:Uncharacterized protein n=1 Tax=Planoprotostelium fungivorum TaxID=1890364 RepID=A0A2P6NSW7_9EUKA|nr:hypothetical protein PROFUN_04799 [Planoprotostelium fungivorum]